MLLCNELVVALLARGQQEHRFFGLLVIAAMNFRDLEERQRRFTLDQLISFLLNFLAGEPRLQNS
jgi:hypothetical protein